MTSVVCNWLKPMWNRRRLELRFLKFTMLVILAAAANLPIAVGAAIFSVSNTGDSGAGSLRQAILDANGAPGDDVISITTTGAVTLASALPTLGDNVTIDGSAVPNFTIDVNGTGTGLSIAPGVTAKIDGITVTGASNSGVMNSGSLTLDHVAIKSNATSGSGGGIDNESGSLVLRNSVVSGNTSSSGQGGGIFNKASLSVTDSTITDNKATNVSGGGIYNAGGNVTVSNSTVNGNSAFHDGGIDNHAGSLTLTASTVSDNTARVGGGIHNESGTVKLISSTVSGNGATVAGGGGILNDANLTITNSTVSGNGAAGPGGGIANDTGASAMISSSTIADNTLGSSGLGITNGGGISNDGTLTLINTLLASNTPDCVGGSVTSSGHNLDSDGTCTLGGPGDISGGNAALGVLANNGGPTETRALLAGSLAIDAGEDAACPTTDQRGVARPQGPHCDIGAFEAVSASATPTPTAGAIASPTSEAAATPTQTPVSLPTVTPPNTGDAGLASIR